MMVWHIEGVLGMDGGVKRSGLCIGGGAFEHKSHHD